MPSDRSQDIIIRYNKVYNIILSQYLLSLATEQKLGDVLIRTQDLMKLDPNSDQYYIELNRVQKAISKDRDHSFELFKDFIVRALNNDVLAVSIEEVTKEKMQTINSSKIEALSSLITKADNYHYAKVSRIDIKKILITDLENKNNLLCVAD